MDIGSEYARRSGLTDPQLLALHDAEASGLFDAEELLIITYARAMSVTPTEVDDQLVAALRERYGDRGILELTHLIAWENARARTNAALGIGAGGFSEGKACAIAASAQPPARPPSGLTRKGRIEDAALRAACIGMPRFELGASPTRTERATRLRHIPRYGPVYSDVPATAL